VFLPHIENCPYSACYWNPEQNLLLTLSYLSVMKAQDFGHWSSTTKRWRYGHIKSGGIYICEFMKTQSGLVAINPGWPIGAVTRPKPPQNQIRALRLRVESQPIDSTMLAEPVTRLNMVGSLVAGISERSGLFSREIPSLSSGDPIQFFLRLIWVFHNRSTFLTHYAIRIA
jgi:hypothetical protein